MDRGFRVLVSFFIVHKESLYTRWSTIQWMDSNKSSFLRLHNDTMHATLLSIFRPIAPADSVIFVNQMWYFVLIAA